MNLLTHQKKVVPKTPAVSSGARFWKGSRRMAVLVLASRSSRDILTMKIAIGSIERKHKFFATYRRPNVMISKKPETAR